MVQPGKIKSTFMVDAEVYKGIRILAIERDVEVSTIIEEAMREKLEREYPERYRRPQPQQPQQEQKADKMTAYTSQTYYQSQPPQPQQQQSQDIFKADRSRPKLRKDERVRPQQEPQEQEPEIIRKANLLPQIKKGIESFPLWLPGLKFPKTERDLTEYLTSSAKAGSSGEFLLSFIQELPHVNKKYKNKEELEEDLRKAIYKHIGKVQPLSKKENRTVECIIAVDEDEEAAKQYFRTERMRRSKLMGTLIH
jgi:hypothetical protein